MEREDGYLISYQNDQSLVEDLHPKLEVCRIRSAKWWGINELLYALGLFPCYFLNWAWSAWKRREELIDRPGIIFAIYPVFSDLVIAFFLHRQYGFPLLVDFRDDFSGVMSRGWRRIFSLIYRYLEYRILQAADHVTVTTEVLRNDLLKRYTLESDKISVVYNIVPTNSDFMPGEKCEKKPFRMIYAGAISFVQRPEILLKAYAWLIEHSPEMRQKLHIDIYGPESPYFKLQVKKHLIPGVEFHGFLSRQEIVKCLSQIDVGFLSLGDATYSYAMPTKLFEYIEFGVPIVAVLPTGAARDLIERCDIGLVADVDDVEGLANCLQEICCRPGLRGRFGENMASIRMQFRPAEQARKWREILLGMLPERFTD